MSRVINLSRSHDRTIRNFDVPVVFEMRGDGKIIGSSQTPAAKWSWPEKSLFMDKYFTTPNTTPKCNTSPSTTPDTTPDTTLDAPFYPIL